MLTPQVALRIKSGLLLMQQEMNKTSVLHIHLKSEYHLE